MIQPKRKLIELMLDYDYFKYDRRPAQVDHFVQQHPNRKINIFEKITTDEAGIHVHFVGYKYPKHCFPFHQAIFACDSVKKYVMSVVHTLARKELKLAYIGFAFISWKNKIKILETACETFIRFADGVLNKVHFSDGLTGTVYLKKHLYCDFSRALWCFISTFLKELGIYEDIADRVGEIIATLFEYDDAYRYRMEDIMSETDNYTFRTQPRSELKRLGEIIAQRDHIVSDKFQKGIRLLRLALLSRKVRAAFRMAIFLTEFRHLQLDEADRYHVLSWTDYDFLGKTIEERQEMWREIHSDGLPPVIDVP